MRKRLFKILSGVSMLLCAATCATWVLSYSHWFGATLAFDRSTDTNQNRYDVHAVLGKFELSRIQLRGIDPAFQFPPGFHTYCRTHKEQASVFRYWYTSQGGGAGAGFLWLKSIAPASQACRQRVDYYIAIPAWLPTIAWLFLAVWWGTRRQRRPSCCVVCGYDLRATPNRCPECGTAPMEILVSSE